MYQYLDALVRPKHQGQYLKEPLLDVPLFRAFALYDHIYLYLTHPMMVDDDGELVTLGLDLTTLQNTLMADARTIGEWLAGLGNQSLPTDHPAKVLDRRFIRYTDARRAGCYLTRVYRNAHPDSEYPLDDRRNLLIQRPDDPDGYVSFYDNHLVTLNGFLHQTEHTAHGVLVPHAVETLEKSNVDTVGLISFEDIGGVVQHTIAPEDLKSDGNNNPLGRRFALDFVEDIGDKSMALVIMGRLITDPRVFRKFNRHRILVDVEQLDLETMYQYAHDKIDLSGLPIEPVRDQDDVVLIEQLRSDDCLRAIMSLPQSFVVFFNAQRVVETHNPVANTDVSGRVIAHQEPTEPLIGAYGYYVDYWTQHDWGEWVLNFPEQWVQRYFHDTIDRKDRIATTGHHGTVHPRRFPQFRLHRIETQHLITPET